MFMLHQLKGSMGGSPDGGSQQKLFFLGLQVKVNQMTIDTKKVLVSDRGLKHQVFVESPPVVAGSIRSYINSFKRIKNAVRATYPTAKFYFKEVDELSMQLKQ